MCGRFTLATSGAEIARHFGLGEVPDLAPRFNVAPGQAIAVVRAGVDPAGRDASGAGPEATPARALALLRWGLVPAWSPAPGSSPRPINARAETAARRPAFRTAFARRRGIVPADGFYEWQRIGRSSRPFWVRLRGGGLFGIAALWERCPGPDGPLETCALLTTEASAPLRSLHDRMPVILDPAGYRRWLDPGIEDAEALEPLLRPLADDRLELRPVTRRVNDVREDDVHLLEPERDLFSAGGAA
jgi:putative SOS response-associated peptidase YedK